MKKKIKRKTCLLLEISLKKVTDCPRSLHLRSFSFIHIKTCLVLEMLYVLYVRICKHLVVKNVRKMKIEKENSII